MVKKGDNILVRKKSIFKKNRIVYKGVVTDIIKEEECDVAGYYVDTIAKILLENGKKIEIEIDSTTYRGYNDYKIIDSVN